MHAYLRTYMHEMSASMDSCMHGCMHARTYMSAQTHTLFACLAVSLSPSVPDSQDRSMDGWMDGWMDVSMHAVYVCTYGCTSCVQVLAVLQTAVTRHKSGIRFTDWVEVRDSASNSVHRRGSCNERTRLLEWCIVSSNVQCRWPTGHFTVGSFGQVLTC